MSIKTFRAVLECDGCAEEIWIDLDPASKGCLADIADEACKDAMNERPKSASGFCSYQANMHLCPACSEVADNIHTDPEREPTSDEIKQALGAIL